MSTHRHAPLWTGMENRLTREARKNWVPQAAKFSVLFSLSLILFSVRRFFNLLQIVRWRQHFWRTLFLQGGYRGLLPPMK